MAEITDAETLEPIDTPDDAVVSEGEDSHQIRVGVLTVSDRCTQGEREDLSGPAIQAALADGDYVVVLYAVVPDDRKIIADTIKRWTSRFVCDVILTTGGTGFGPRDVTPEATRKVIDREAPNIMYYLLSKGIQVNPMAALSRGIAGTRGDTLIVNLPGSPGAARECTEWLCELFPHLIDVLKRRETSHPTPPEDAV
jgi:molybdopterin adenylyltransferase